jgi:hypothetical protein
MTKKVYLKNGYRFNLEPVGGEIVNITIGKRIIINH